MEQTVPVGSHASMGCEEKEDMRFSQLVFSIVQLHVSFYFGLLCIDLPDFRMHPRPSRGGARTLKPAGWWFGTWLL